MIAGWGTNEGLIISILGHRNAAQRKLIRQAYAEAYGEDLLKALDKELSNDFEVRVWTSIFNAFSVSPRCLPIDYLMTLLSTHTHIRSLTLVLWFSKNLAVRGCCCFGPLIQLKGMLLWLMRPQRDGLRAIRYLWRLPARGHQMNCFLQGRLIMLVLRSPLKRMLHITQVGTSARYSF